MSKRLEAELERFKNPMMLTCTIDPVACPDPRRIYTHLKRVRAAGELVRSLFNLGFLEMRDYFCAVEFQMGKRRDDGGATEQVHLHIIIDAKATEEHPGGFVPIWTVQERWNRFRPFWAVEVDGRPDGHLGWVQFEKIDNRKGIAIYATKYIAKGSKEGLPEWFMSMIDQDRRCTLSSHSRGFWKATAKAKPQSVLQKRRRKRARFKPRPFRERVADCGTQVDLYYTQTFLVEGGVKIRPHFRESVPAAFDEAAELLHVSEDEERRRVIPLSPARLETWQEFIKKRNAEIYQGNMRSNCGGWDDGIPGNGECVPQARSGVGGMARSGSAEAGQVARLDDQRGHQAVAETHRKRATGPKIKPWEAVGQGGTQVRETFWYAGRRSRAAGDDDSS